MATTGEKDEGRSKERKERSATQSTSGTPQPRGEREARGTAMARRPAEASPALAMPFGRMLSPFSTMRRMFDDMERLMDMMGGGTLAGIGSGALRGEPAEAGELGMFMPRLDLVRRQDQLIVRADLPGMDLDDIQVSIDGNLLVIEGERRSETEQQDEDLWRSERTYGRFCRTVELPPGADPESVDARFSNGVLEIAVRAPEQRRGRRVEIKSADAGNGRDRAALAEGDQPRQGA